MSTIDEVLAAAEVVDAVCIIDGETRIISVPTEYKELGVESDEKVTRVKFQCPKIVGDNIDLTEYNLYINYRNAGNKLNSYLVEDATVTGDTINFSWLLSRHVTESPGTISYIVCAKKSDDTGVINEWNTKVATGIVGIGLEATEEIEEQNVDAIEQILRSIVELENNIGSGGYYSPSIDDEGNLSWMPSKTDMPTVDGANIKGPQGVSGVYVGSGDMPDGYNVQIDPNGTPSGIIPSIDKTLTEQGKAADAKAILKVRDADGTVHEIYALQGKSAYQYAQDGGYTGSEDEFTAKLAEEIPDNLPNPNPLTFTGAVTGSYDGSAPLSVKIPSAVTDDHINSLIEAITTSKVSVADIVDNLTTNVSNKPLSAAQGVVIKALIDALRNDKLDAAELTNAVNTALAQAKASGEFDGAEGKSAYQYAVEGGYTGTETEFAEKLAEEMPDLTDTEIITAPGYTNQIPISTDTGGSVYNGVGYKSGVSLNSSGAEIPSSGAAVSGYIPVRKGDIIRIKDTSQANFDMTLMMTLTAAKAGTENCGKTISNIQGNAMYGTLTINGNVATWDTSGIGYYFWNDFAWLRVTTHSADAIVTVNEEITDTVTTQNVLKPSVKVKKSNVDFDIASPLLSGKTVVCFGDSIFGMTRDTTSVPAWAAAFTGAKAYNVGFGGCRMAKHPSNGYAAFSMWALADAVSTGNYATQDAQAPSGQDYFAQQLAVLKGIDFGSVDTVVIHYGTNDFTGNVAIDNDTDDDDTSTLCGALRYALRKIQTAYPKIRIFISLPIYRKWDSTGAETYTNANGKKLREFCTALAGVADEFNCPCIDGYKALGINTANASAFLADGAHLNEHGRKVFGEYIGGCLIAPSGTESQEMPTTLPNPNALTFTGAVTGSYDGSAAKTVNIPSAVTDDHINSLIDTKLGVIENGSY